jgi:hypothetical protein
MTGTNALPYYTVALIYVVKSFQYIPARQGILTEVEDSVQLTVSFFFNIKRS